MLELDGFIVPSLLASLSRRTLRAAAVVVPSGVFEKLELDGLPDEPRQPLLPPGPSYLHARTPLRIALLSWLSRLSQSILA